MLPLRLFDCFDIEYLPRAEIAFINRRYISRKRGAVMKDSFLKTSELNEIGFGALGKSVKLSRKASVYSPETISIGDNVRIDDFSILSGNITIGRNVHIGAYSALYGKFGITLEDFTTISGNVMLYSASDDFSGEFLTNPTVPERYTHVTGGPIVMKRHSIIGAGTIVLPGVVLEEGCAVGAASLVNKSLEGWKIYCGVPAKAIADRKKDLLQLEKKYLRE